MNGLPYGYDVIGDIHGRFDKLEHLMARLGYRRHGDGFIPPPGRKALFLGDLVDTKPGHELTGGVRLTLLAVRMMTDMGYALCLMGNHEFNAICFHTRNAVGLPLRAHTAQNIHMHQGTLDDFPDHDDPGSDWRTLWLPWMRQLPLFLDMGAFRAVHACWNPSAIRAANRADLNDIGQLSAASDPDLPLGNAVSTLLKGIEVPLPPGAGFMDESGATRGCIRARWWVRPDMKTSYRNIVFPENKRIPDLPLGDAPSVLAEGYDSSAPPVFFGHYLKDPASLPGPETANVACLDHGAGIGGPLVAYRWQGERTLDAGGYISARG